jgi:ABC-type sugar transport system ATPase subunit
MRNGELVTLQDVDDISHDRAVELMTGPRPGGVFPRMQSSAGSSLLEARGLVSDVLHGVDLRLAKGEILGIGGLVGQGQDALLKSLFGDYRSALARSSSGASQRASKKSPCSDHARHCLRAAGAADRGALAPEERGGQSVLRHLAADIAPGGLYRSQGRTADRRRGFNRLKIRVSSTMPCERGGPSTVQVGYQSLINGVIQIAVVGLATMRQGLANLWPAHRDVG